MTLDSIEKASELLKDHLTPSPLLRAFPLERALGGTTRIYLKCENFHATRSFKLRGAFTALRRLKKDQARRGVVSRSSGNFAQALSFAARELGYAATLVMPTTVPRVKAEGAARYGAEILLHGTTHAEGEAKVAEISEQQGKVALSPYDHPDVIAGHGTVAWEAVRELESIDMFLSPVGGGGLAAGCALVYKSFFPSGRFVGVEPSGADDFYQSRLKKERVAGNVHHSIADGLRAPMVGSLAWPMLRDHVDHAVLVTDEEIIQAMAFLYREMGLVVEPSAAVCVAVLLHRRIDLPEGNVVCLVTGGNVDLSSFHSWIQR